MALSIVLMTVILALVIAIAVLDTQNGGYYIDQVKAYAGFTNGAKKEAAAHADIIAKDKKIKAEGLANQATIADVATNQQSNGSSMAATCQSNGNLALESLLPKADGMWADNSAKVAATSDYVAAIDKGNNMRAQTLGSTRLANLQFRPDPEVGTMQIKALQSDFVQDRDRLDFAMFD